MFAAGSENRRWLVAVALVVMGVWSRWIPHTPNFTAIGASALFAGVLWRRQWQAFLVPLAAMLVSDLLLGWHSTILFVYAALLFNVLIGASVAKMKWGKVSAPILGSLVFFAITNLGVWLSGELYPVSAAGLAECFAMAVPFYKMELLSEVLFFSALLGAWSLSQRVWTASFSRIR